MTRISPSIYDSLSVVPISVHGDGILSGAPPTELQIIRGSFFHSHPILNPVLSLRTQFLAYMTLINTISYFLCCLSIICSEYSSQSDPFQEKKSEHVMSLPQTFHVSPSHLG